MKPKTLPALSCVLSEKTIKQLQDDLKKKNVTDLSGHLEKLFGYKEIFNLHADHLRELAEYIIDLVSDDDPVAYAKRTGAYIKKEKQKYHREQAKTVRMYQWAKQMEGEDSVHVLDLEYRCSVYRQGFAYSRFHAYILMERLARFVIEGARS